MKLTHSIPKTQHSSLSTRVFTIPALTILISVLLLGSFNVNAQKIDQNTSSAMAAIIALLLFDRESPIPRPAGRGVELELSQEIQDPFAISENLFAEFELQSEDVELCFILTSSAELDANILRIEVNGVPQAAQLGENCFKLSEPAQRLINYINVIVRDPEAQISLSALELQPNNQSQLLLPRLTRGDWDERAVRKVLKVFAFGGHATDQQITSWSQMDPADAIQEMLNFDQHNLKLSPLAPNEQYHESSTQNGTLWEWQTWMSSRTTNIPIPAELVLNDGRVRYPRDQYGLDGNDFDEAFSRMITVRGMNPFRQRIGFWETNYHLAVNLDAGVSRREVAAYYDLIMQAHEGGLPYYQVIGKAAKSAAIAEQYGHDRNLWLYDRRLDEYVCACNDDFAREIHQLFFGIFGSEDPEHHETVTIPNTARMLTDMPINDSDANLSDVRVNFGTDEHYSGLNGEPELSILNHVIPHSSSADQKIDYLMPLSIQHPESLENLPILVVEGLADNNLTNAKKDQLRASWRSMGQERVLLDFIHAYAISKLFHDASQLRYLTSHERALYMANKSNLDNFEAYFGGDSYSGRAGRTTDNIVRGDGAGEFFRPIRNVFGGQSPQDAADSALAFENNYNRLTEREFEMRTSVQCGGCDQGLAWEKRWHEVLPRRSDGNFYVSDVAVWLWNHVVGDMDHYTELEKAHLYSILGAARRAPGRSSDQNHVVDFTLLMCMVNDYKRETDNPDLSIENILETVVHQHCTFFKSEGEGYDNDEISDINRVYTRQQIENDPEIQGLLAQLGEQTLPLESENLTNSSDLREHARERVNNALAFIFTTPFVFAEGQQ